VVEATFGSMLPPFEVVFDRYVSLVSYEMGRTNAQFRLEYEDMRHLIEAHTLATKALEERSFLETSGWGRQVGASAVALALLANNPSVHLVNSSHRMTKTMMRRLCDVFHEERVHSAKRYEAYNHPAYKHARLWSMSTLRNDILCQAPGLIIFDSDTMWHRGAQEEMRDIHNILKCGVVVFKSTIR
jgi:hypothetical protein